MGFLFSASFPSAEYCHFRTSNLNINPKEKKDTFILKNERERTGKLEKDLLTAGLPSCNSQGLAMSKSGVKNSTQSSHRRDREPNQLDYLFAVLPGGLAGSWIGSGRASLKSDSNMSCRYPKRQHNSQNK